MKLRAVLPRWIARYTDCFTTASPRYGVKFGSTSKVGFSLSSESRARTTATGSNSGSGSLTTTCHCSAAAKAWISLIASSGS